MRTWALILTGLFVHIVFFYSIFDIYFTSPLVHGMTPVVSNESPPAKRLVLFVADGLRADKFFEIDGDGKSRAPYLRTVIEETGAWGVSHTRVPTESRPGHVALIAGFYEDVSAVAKGWKENPVEFDSVFNESRYTWSWGSPDILPMFAKGASGDHVLTDQYPSELEDFADSDSSKLDTWVFDRVKALFERGRRDNKLAEQLNQDKIVFFFHLLGIDTNGHSHKPQSKEYLENIGLVDSGIKKMTELIEQYYGNDGKTSYLMTADHGMTNWGSHGAGHPHETLTPLVAWGAGVRQPVTRQHTSDPDSYSEDWNLKTLMRSDVQQADIAPLMAYLIGVPYPVNSVGVLPIDYLDCDDRQKSQSLYANARQILSQYQIKMEKKKQTTLSMTFRPYSELTPAIQAEMIRTINKLIQAGDYSTAIKESQELMRLTLQGLNYYQTYDRFFLGVSITSGFIGWTLYILVLVVKEHTDVVRVRVKLVTLQQPVLLRREMIVGGYSSLGALIFILLAVQSLPWTYYLYCLLPVALWTVVTLNWYVLQDCSQRLKASPTGVCSSLCLTVLMCILGLEILVAGFFYRELLSVGLVCMGVLPLLSSSQSSDRVIRFGWAVSSLTLAIFPLMPVVGRETNYLLVGGAGMLAICTGVLAIHRLQHSSSPSQHIFSINWIQIALTAMSVYIVMSTSSSIQRKQGLPVINQVFSWLILGVSLVIPMLSGTGVLHRVLTITLAYLPLYLLLSISHEGLFVITLCYLLYFWLQLEEDTSSQMTGHMKQVGSIDFVSPLMSEIKLQQRYLQLEDVRRAFYFVFLMLTGFFGTGNIASINSFEPASVYCFLTVFSPFTMGTLMMLKNVIPLVLVTCTFRAIHITTNVPIRALFLLVLAMSDLMALNFFFLVRDYGSWLEIGTSISHYVIVMCMIIFLMLLFGLSHGLTTFSMIPRKSLKTGAGSPHSQ
ncbi:GPI ethanolamine phosphate transferase 1-like [Mizuhopecten yessoensis]|uniref:GPI ethanolamine phosphate transferase 1-like n=1 Tax=Mizuhopecten yessoensis TaxID=6573 RepID=UPI000B45D5B6|nr:GPI ethanolamine phosphate transferase 1-like [Mizuhopecten yessoensis]